MKSLLLRGCDKPFSKSETKEVSLFRADHLLKHFEFDQKIEWELSKRLNWYWLSLLNDDAEQFDNDFRDAIFIPQSDTASASHFVRELWIISALYNEAEPHRNHTKKDIDRLNSSKRTLSKELSNVLSAYNRLMQNPAANEMLNQVNEKAFGSLSNFNKQYRVHRNFADLKRINESLDRHSLEILRESHQTDKRPEPKIDRLLFAVMDSYHFCYEKLPKTGIGKDALDLHACALSVCEYIGSSLKAATLEDYITEAARQYKTKLQTP